MKIKIKLMGMLKSHSPPNGELDFDDPPSIAEVLAALDLPSDAAQAFSVNGAIQRDKTARLQNNDELVVLPPVGGG